MSITTAYRGGDRPQQRQGWRIVLEYDEETIDQLKARIPAADREWNPSGQYWWVAAQHEDTLCQILPGFELYRHQAQLF